MIHKTTILFVVHSGKLETQSLLLAASLRLFNNEKFELVACLPENISSDKTFVTEQTEKYLASLNVTIRAVQNPINSDYLIGNKLNCLSATGAENRLFLDTDTLCFADLKLPSLSENEIAIKPADRKTYTWTDEQWQYAYMKHASHPMNKNELICSSVFRETMWPYFNAGVIYINRNHGFAKTWSNIAKAIDSDEALSDKRPWLDQLALPLAIKATAASPVYLSEKHNFPANIKAIKSGIKHEIIHYHRPSVLANSQLGIETIIKIVDKYPWLLKVFKNDSDWHCVADRLVQHSKVKAKLKNKNINHVLVTQVSDSIRDELLANLNATSTSQVIPHPSKILKPISRRYYPWGIASYLSQVEYQYKLTRPSVNEVLYTVDHSLIFSVLRIKSILPECQVLINVNNPFETVKKWSPDFLTAKSDERKMLNQQSHWFRAQQKSMMNSIFDNEDIEVRHALYWCMLVQELIDAKTMIKVELINRLSMKQLVELQSNSPSLKRSDKKIWQIISSHYLELLEAEQI